MMVGAKSANKRLSGTFHYAFISCRLEDYFGQLFFGLAQLFARNHSPRFKKPLLDQLSLAGLNCKVCLSKCYLFFFWITVLGDEVAGIASKHKIRDFFFRALRHLDRFPDVGKMIIDCVP